MAKGDLKSFLQDIGIEQVLTQGDARLLRPALEQLMDYLKPFAKDEHRTVMMMMANLNQLQRKRIQRRIDDDKYDREVGDIIYQLSIFIEDLPTRLRLYQNLTTPIKQPRVSFKKEDIPEDNSNLEKIIGKNTLKNIAWLSKGLEMARSVCRILVPVEKGHATGTGFLVEGGFIYTNNHVISSIEEAASAKIQFNYEEDLRGRLMQPVEFKLAPSVKFETSKELDFTLVKVDEASSDAPLSDFGFLTIDAKAVPEVQDHVVIIQHPGGGTKKIALTANQVMNIYDHRLQYTTDTMRGSSGSPVFTDDWVVVGLHHAGGDMAINDQGDSMYVNQAILFQHIFEFLSK